MDKSWGGDTSATFRIKTNDSLADRAAARAKAREARVAERAATMEQRLERRADTREADVAAREEARTARRAREVQLAAGDPHAAAAQRHRSSGRKDIVRQERDTSSYTMIVDAGRIRELARRGTSASSIAAVLGISQQEVEQALAQPE